MKLEHNKIIRINGSKQIIIIILFFGSIRNDFHNNFCAPATTVEHKWTIGIAGKFLVSG